jgi:acyl carrier protein
VATNNMDSLLSKVRLAFHDAFGVNPPLISLETAPDDIPGWDSVGHLILATSLESTFEVTFDVDELMAMENVREIVAILRAKLNGV